MKKIKKAARLLAYACLIVLAGIGIGLSGGVPLPSLKIKRDPEKEKIELVEGQNQKADNKQSQIKG